MKAESVKGWPKGNRARMLLSDTSAAQVNAIRRTMIADVAKMAITKVRFEQGVTQDNKGEVLESVNVLPDEVLAHRLAMTPIPTFLEEFVFPEDDPNNADLPEDQWGSPLSQIIYHCNARGPSSDSDEEFKTVYAGDMNVLGESKLQIAEEHEKIPLTILSKGQYLEFYAYASLGRGRDHTKWSPASAIGFHPRMKAVLKNAKKAKILFDLGLSTSDGTSIDAKIFDKKGECIDIDTVCDLTDALHQVGYGTGRDEAFADAIVLEEIPGEFILNFESDGSLSCDAVFNQACSELAARLSSISKDLDKALA